MGTDYEERTHYLRRADTALEGERESRDWLKAVPRVAGLDRPLQGMGKTTAKRPRNGSTPPDTPEAA
jgi:hypothetical protein